jgi:hypothetical protein
MSAKLSDGIALQRKRHDCREQHENRRQYCADAKVRRCKRRASSILGSMRTGTPRTCPIRCASPIETAREIPFRLAKHTRAPPPPQTTTSPFLWFAHTSKTHLSNSIALVPKASARSTRVGPPVPLAIRKRPRRGTQHSTE